MTEVVSPAMIWCQIVDKENVEPLQDIMGKMAEVSSLYRKILTSEKIAVIILKVEQWFYYTVLRPKDAAGMSKSVRSSLIWVYTV